MILVDGLFITQKHSINFMSWCVHYKLIVDAVKELNLVLIYAYVSFDKCERRGSTPK